MLESDKKRLEEIIDQMRKTGEAKFGWIKDIDADLTEGKLRFDSQIATSAKDIAERTTEGTETKTQNIKAGDNKVETFTEDKADINRDGKIEGADENQKLQQIKKEQDEATKDALKFLGDSFQFATGISFAKDGVDNNASLPAKIKDFIGKIF